MGMGLWAWLKRVFTFPNEATYYYRCVECEAVVIEAETACPECGGDLEEHYREPIEFYWPQT